MKAYKFPDKITTYVIIISQKVSEKHKNYQRSHAIEFFYSTGKLVHIFLIKRSSNILLIPHITIQVKTSII